MSRKTLSDTTRVRIACCHPMLPGNKVISMKLSTPNPIKWTMKNFIRNQNVDQAFTFFKFPGFKVLKVSSNDFIIAVILFNVFWFKRLLTMTKMWMKIGKKRSIMSVALLSESSDTINFPLATYIPKITNTTEVLITSKQCCKIDVEVCFIPSEKIAKISRTPWFIWSHRVSILFKSLAERVLKQLKANLDGSLYINVKLTGLKNFLCIIVNVAN